MFHSLFVINAIAVAGCCVVCSGVLVYWCRGVVVWWMWLWLWPWLILCMCISFYDSQLFSMFLHAWCYCCFLMFFFFFGITRDRKRFEHVWGVNENMLHEIYEWTTGKWKIPLYNFLLLFLYFNARNTRFKAKQKTGKYKNPFSIKQALSNSKNRQASIPPDNGNFVEKKKKNVCHLSFFFSILCRN